MLIILSQKIDSDSIYIGDEVFKTYHYPGRYRNQIHEGDTFIYYQGNRLDKSQRYYFGTGIVEQITKQDADNYYAKLKNVKRFQKIVPIYLPDGGYIEQLGYETVRKSVNPPWQSSIRPLSEEAYKYILQHSGKTEMITEYDSKLKRAIQKYYIDKEPDALTEIESLVKEMAVLYHL